MMPPLPIPAPQAAPSTVLMCNTVDAEGAAVPYLITISGAENPTLSVQEIGKRDAQSVAATDVARTRNNQIAFTANLSGKSLRVKIWGGFSRPLSSVDAVDVSGKSAGLVSITGICGASSEFRAIRHKFTEPRYPVIEGKTLQYCFSVTLDGRYFSAVENRGVDSESFSTFGLGDADFRQKSMKVQNFPPLPKQEGYENIWRAIDPSEGQKPAFVSEFRVNLSTMIASEILDFQALDSAVPPVMVGRGHCGLFAVQRGNK